MWFAWIWLGIIQFVQSTVTSRSCHNCASVNVCFLNVAIWYCLSTHISAAAGLLIYWYGDVYEIKYLTTANGNGKMRNFSTIHEIVLSPIKNRSSPMCVAPILFGAWSSFQWPGPEITESGYLCLSTPLTWSPLKPINYEELHFSILIMTILKDSLQRLPIWTVSLGRDWGRLV